MPTSRRSLLSAAGTLACTASLVAGVAVIDGGPAGASTFAASLATSSGQAVPDGATLSSSALPLHTAAPGTALADVKYVLDGHYLGRVTAAPFAVPGTVASGEHKLRATAEATDGAVNEFTVRFTLTGTGGTSAPSSPPSTTSPPSSPPSTTPPPSSTPPAGSSDVTVTDAQSLAAALAQARPGETITLADGRYLGNTVRDTSGHEPGRFVASAAGTVDAPITLRGSRNAVLDGGGPGGGYGLHLTGASYWHLVGFTVSGASKGIVLDRSTHVLIDGVAVTNIGMEGVHFRAFSTDNVLRNSTVTGTGVSSPGYGEGVYIGSANSNWATYTGGQPDRSDRNQILGNDIAGTGAENIDIKEGTTGGVVDGNLLDGDGMSGVNSADSWIDVKGNGYRISNNHGVHRSVTLDPARFVNCDARRNPAYPAAKDAPFCNGFEVHTAMNGWGRENVFDANVLDVNANSDNKVVGIWLQNTAVGAGNVIHCNNSVTGATAGNLAYNHFTALPCTN